jgi:hypothetical protein
MLPWRLCAGREPDGVTGAVNASRGATLQMINQTVMSKELSRIGVQVAYIWESPRKGDVVLDTVLADDSPYGQRNDVKCSG